MSLTFVTGRSGTGKSTYLFKHIIDQAIKNPKTDYLIIVPEQFTMAIQKEIVRLHPNNCVMNIDILSFNRLAYRVFDELGMEAKEPLADTGKNMVIRNIIQANNELLGTYGRNYNKQGFISEIKSFISELYQYGITPEYIEKFITDNPKDKRIVNKLKEILVIYTEFEKFLGDRYITAESLSDRLASVIDSSKSVAGSVVVMDGFTGFTPSQIKLVTKILKLSKETYVSLTIDPKKDNSSQTSLFYLTYKTKQSLIKIAKAEAIDIMPDIVMDNADDRRFELYSKEMSFLEANMFRYPRAVYKDEVKDICIASMVNAREEVSYVADEIEKLVSQGYRYKDIAVVCGDMDRYSDVAKQVLSKRRIPCFVDNKKKVKDNPYIEFLSSAMEIVVTKYAFDSMFRFIRCNMSGITKDEADIIENYALAAGIRGKAKWSKIWSSQFRRNYEERMEEINAIRQKVYEGTKNLAKLFPENATVGEYAKSLEEISVMFNCEEKLAYIADRFAADNEFGYEKEYDKVYEAVQILIAQMKELLGDTQVELGEFIKIFDAGVAEIKIGVIPQTTDQIVVGDIERSRLNDIKVMFMLGTNDGLIPKATSSTTVMSEIERERLLELGFEMSPTRRQATFIGNFYLYSNMTKATDKLFIVYSRMDDDAHEIARSFIIAQIMKIFPRMTIISKREELRRNGYDYLMEKLADRDKNAVGSECNEIISWNLTHGENTDFLEQVLDAAFDDKTDTPITEEVAKHLYDNSRYSVSRIEKYASCAYAHFLNYGLGLSARDEYEIMATDMGIIFHEVMENYANGLRLTNTPWENVSREKSDMMIDECVDAATQKFENGILYDNKRNEFMVKQIRRIAKRTGWTLCRHVANGKFVPAAFEVKFIKSIGDKKYSKDTLAGVVDRIDICQTDDNTLVKIIDYKSSDRTFDTALFKEGISMQLIVYMDAAINHGKELNGLDNKDKKRIPAGAFYYTFNDPIVEGKDSFMSFNENNTILYNDDEIDTEIGKNLKMSGIINENEAIYLKLDDSISFGDKGKFKSDTMEIVTDKNQKSADRGVGFVTTEQFENLINYSSQMIDNINTDIKKGIVGRNPYRYGDKNSCKYCDYASVCRYGEGKDTPFRNIKKEKFDEFVNKISAVTEGTVTEGRVTKDEVDHSSEESN